MKMVRRPVPMLREPLDVGVARNVVAVRRLQPQLVATFADKAGVHEG